MYAADQRFHINGDGEVAACDDPMLFCKYGGDSGALNHFAQLKEAEAARDWRASPLVKRPLSSGASIQRLIEECVITNDADFEVSRIDVPYVDTEELSIALFTLEDAQPYKGVFADADGDWTNVLEELAFELHPHRPSSRMAQEVIATLFPRAFEVWLPELARLEILEDADLLHDDPHTHARFQSSANIWRAAAPAISASENTCPIA